MSFLSQSFEGARGGGPRLVLLQAPHARVDPPRGQQVGVDVDRPDDRQQERQELGVGVGRIARVQQVALAGAAQRCVG